MKILIRFASSEDNRNTSIYLHYRACSSKNNKLIKFKSCMQPPGTYIVPEILDTFFWSNRIMPPRGSTLALWNLKRPAQTHPLSFSPALSWTLAQVSPCSHMGWGGRQQALERYDQEAESIPQGLRAFIIMNILPRICFWRFSLIFPSNLFKW